MAGAHVKQHRTLREEGQAPSKECLSGDAFGAPSMLDRVGVVRVMNLRWHFTVGTPATFSPQRMPENWLYAYEALRDDSHVPAPGRRQKPADILPVE